MSEKLTTLRAEQHQVRIVDPLPPFYISLSGLSRILSWPRLCRDLIEVSTSILLVDRLVRRPRGVGPRNILLNLYVRQPGTWKKVTPRLQEVLQTLTGDKFAFNVHKKIEDSPWFSQDGFGEQGLSIDRVVLFSGGLDSAAAAATFAQQGLRTVYVTHYVTGIRRVENLLKEINAVYGDSRETLHAQFYIRPSGDFVQQVRENSRRCRSFLFTSLALATAISVGAKEVCVCENGPLALNIPLTPAMIPTRHANSQFLLALEQFASELFGVQIRVYNPFELLTKGEMSRVFASQPDIALRTVSCWNHQWSGQGVNYGNGHCGYCIPCLVRRVSLEHAGINIPSRHFDKDVIALADHSRLPRKELHLLRPYKALTIFSAGLLQYRTWKEFLRQNLQVVDALPTDRTMSISTWYRSLFRMMQRFSKEVIHTFGEASE